MSRKTLITTMAVLGGLLFICLVFLGIFGYQLANYKTAKTKEIEEKLATQAKELKAAFQSELEVTTTTYTASEVFGSFKFTYPKVWSTNVTQEANASQALTFLGDPDMIVLDKDADGPYVALRVEVYATAYETMVKNIVSKYITGNKAPYSESDVTVSNLDSKKFTGTDSDSGKKVIFYLVPLRDKTLYIGTDDADSYSDNLDTIIKTFEISK